VSETEFVNEIHSLLDKWRMAQDEALKGSAPKLVFKELGSLPASSVTFFPTKFSQVYVDQEEDSPKSSRI